MTVYHINQFNAGQLFVFHGMLVAWHQINNQKTFNIRQTFGSIQE
jgi:hypothetical protein